MPTQATPVKAISARQYTITTADDGLWLDMGPAGVNGTVGTFVTQFNPSGDFSGTIMVATRVFGPAAASLAMPPLPAPYRRVNVNGVASDYAISSAQITGAGIIQIPSNGMSVLLLVSCGTGSCGLASWDLNGPSAV